MSFVVVVVGASMCVCVHVCESVGACVYMCVCTCVCMHVGALDGEGSKVLASIALVVVLMAINLTSYSDCLTFFHDPLLPLVDVIPVSKMSNAINGHVSTVG